MSTDIVQPQAVGVIMQGVEIQDQPEESGYVQPEEQLQRLQIAEKRLAAVEEQLVEAKQDRDEVTTRLVHLEHEFARLMNLYVATYELHATLDPVRVQRTITEVAVTLLGAESLVLLVGSNRSNVFEVAVREGDLAARFFPDVLYTSGIDGVDQALSSAAVFFGGSREPPVAVVPLVVEGVVIGALVILELLEHKEALHAGDRELIDLLAAHAASALLAAKVYSKTDRKLRTLEGLMQLVQSKLGK